MHAVSFTFLSEVEGRGGEEKGRGPDKNRLCPLMKMMKTIDDPLPYN
jgi:hypothetical protein